METGVATASELLRGAADRLAAAGIETARLDAEVLLALALQTDRSGMYGRLGDEVAPDVAQQFEALIDRRVTREPIAYITGEQEFWSLPFAVTPAVLIPRPETESLVDAVRRAAQADGVQSICDVGTGSGCVAVAVARELPETVVLAVDVSAVALDIAATNAARLGVAQRVTFLQSDLFDALPASTKFDAIVSNPPYCRPNDPLPPELAFEPSEALTAGDDGLDVVRRLIAAAPARLRPAGWLIMELGQGQAEAVRGLAREAGLHSIEVEPDLAGIPRVLIARR